MVVSHHMGSGNQTLVLCRSSRCSEPLSHLSSPSSKFLKTEAGDQLSWQMPHPVPSTPLGCRGFATDKSFVDLVLSQLEEVLANRSP